MALAVGSSARSNSVVVGSNVVATGSSFVAASSYHMAIGPLVSRYRIIRLHHVMGIKVVW